MHSQMVDPPQWFGVYANSSMLTSPFLHLHPVACSKHIHPLRRDVHGRAGVSCSNIRRPLFLDALTFITTYPQLALMDRWLFVIDFISVIRYLLCQSLTVIYIVQIRIRLVPLPLSLRLTGDVRYRLWRPRALVPAKVFLPLAHRRCMYHCGLPLDKALIYFTALSTPL